MSTNNFSQIVELLEFSNPLDFYFLQIMKRRKDNPDLDKGVRIIKDFYITSQEDLLDKQEEIIALCDEHNARATIRLNKRNLGVCALHCYKEMLDKKIQRIESGEESLRVLTMLNDVGLIPKWTPLEITSLIMKDIATTSYNDAEDLDELKFIMAKVAGHKPATVYENSSKSVRANKRWVVDIDSVDPAFQAEVQRIIEEIHSEMAAKKTHDYKIICNIPSKNGCHLITGIFDSKAFDTKIKSAFGKDVKVDIQKDSTTNLYIP